MRSSVDIVVCPNNYINQLYQLYHVPKSGKTIHAARGQKQDGLSAANATICLYEQSAVFPKLRCDFVSDSANEIHSLFSSFVDSHTQGLKIS